MNSILTFTVSGQQSASICVCTVAFTKALYDERYSAYRELYRSTSNIVHRLSASAAGIMA